MILFVPINVYRVHYQVAKGRPFSSFERILLSAIARESLTTTKIAKDLFVPERLVIEALATLLEADWIALDETTNGGLVLTQAGRRALETPEQLPPTTDLRDTSAWIAQERLQGQIVLQEGVRYERRDILEKGNLFSLEAALAPSDSVPNYLDPGQVVPLLRIGDSSFLNWVGPVEIHHSGNIYLLVSINPEKGTLTNLPRAWEPLLREQLVDHARFLHKQRGEVGPDEKQIKEYLVPRDIEPQPATWQVPKDSLEVIYGSEKNTEILIKSLLECDYLFLASSALDPSVVQDLQLPLQTALGRGVTIDILYGHTHRDDENHTQALDILKKLAYDSARQGNSGRLLINHEPSFCHANVLLRVRYHHGTSEAAVFFASHRWLADPKTSSLRTMSLKLTHEAPVGYLCRLLADLANHDRQLSAGSAKTRLPNLAAELERRLMKPSVEDDDDTMEEQVHQELQTGKQEPTVTFWLDRQVRSPLEKILEGAQNRLAIFSPELDDLSALRELDQHRASAPLSVYYDNANWDDRSHILLLDRIAKLPQQKEVTLTHLPSLKTSVLVKDQTHFILSTQSFWAPFPKAKKTLSSTLSIEVKNSELATDIQNWLFEGRPK